MRPYSQSVMAVRSWDCAAADGLRPKNNCSIIATQAAYTAFLRQKPQLAAGLGERRSVGKFDLHCA